MKKWNFTKWTGLMMAFAYGFIYWPVRHGGCTLILHEPVMPEEMKELIDK